MTYTIQKKAIGLLLGAGLVTLVFIASQRSQPAALMVKPGEHIVLLGGNLGSRMSNYGHFETEMQVRYPDYKLFIRNMCDPGDTPGFRPRSARNSPWAFPGAKQFQDEYANPSDSQGFFPSDDEWLTNLKADVILGFFGYSESEQGEAGLANFKAELAAFIQHTKAQQYNGKNAPQLVLVSPTAVEDLTDSLDVPDGKEHNKNLLLYTSAMREVAKQHDVLLVDAFAPSQKWYAESPKPLTIDGVQLTDAGYRKLATLLTDEIFGKAPAKAEANRTLVHTAVLEKNWMWLNDYKIPNGVHVYGRRF
ncbi:MAG: SGNH/GDSL hydrolase family protein, partial [Spirosoma sp.]|nr:SGNH/GDSL hydrolase family protein [Spirosoma sp.]